MADDRTPDQVATDLLEIGGTYEFETAARLIREQATKLHTAEDALRRHGYRKSCDIPACNCGDQWNHGGNAAERLRELADVLYENGKTPLAVAKELVERVDIAEYRLGKVRELRDFLDKLDRSSPLNHDLLIVDLDTALGLSAVEAQCPYVSGDHSDLCAECGKPLYDDVHRNSRDRLAERQWPNTIRCAECGRALDDCLCAVENQGAEHGKA